MESLTLLRQAVLRALTPSPTARYPMPEVQEQLVQDVQQNRFLVVRTGWHQGTNYYAVIQDVELRGDVVFIHQNNTEHDLEAELTAAGVAADRIVVATAAPEHRQRLAS